MGKKGNELQGFSLGISWGVCNLGCIRHSEERKSSGNYVGQISSKTLKLGGYVPYVQFLKLCDMRSIRKFVSQLFAAETRKFRFQLDSLVWGVKRCD